MIAKELGPYSRAYFCLNNELSRCDAQKYSLTITVKNKHQEIESKTSFFALSSLLDFLIFLRVKTLVLSRMGYLFHHRKYMGYLKICSVNVIYVRPHLQFFFYQFKKKKTPYASQDS